MFHCKPVIKWAGGKTRMLEQLSRHIPADFNNYHEPFIGGGAMFFHLIPELIKKNATAFLSDMV
ncbi:MAG: DNA adenine methylase, partial [Desulfotomaculaceae bacterium]